ncbi:MAG: response regulator [Candidatus Zixiibacteriota bacterium]
MDSFRVLFVDDEEELVSTLVERLGYRGINAEYATNGDGALEKLRTASYDIAVIDLKLPGMSGNELIGIVKKSYPNLPVIMITGHGSNEVEDSEHPNGAFAYLQKPIDIATLIKRMKEAIESNES